MRGGREKIERSAQPNGQSKYQSEKNTVKCDCTSIGRWTENFGLKKFELVKLF